MFTEYARVGPTKGRTMRLVRVDRLTADAVALELSDPNGAQLDFQPGQFVTVVVRIGDAEHRRAYSICSPSHTRTSIRIGVKRLGGGIVSTFLCDQMRVGDRLDVLGPSGTFTVRPDPEQARQLVLIAGGSGITPMLSIAESVLLAEPASSVVLVFGNRSPADVMFRDDIERLAMMAAGRLVVRHVLENVTPGFTARCGRLTRDVLDEELAALSVAARDVTFFVCGPDAMMDEARVVLAARGVTPDQIRFERFAPAARRVGAAPSDRRVPITICADGREYRATASARQTVLEAGLAAGAPMPFSCTVGGCGTCRVRVVSGQIEMDEPNCLLPEERAAGFALACVARAATAITIDISGGKR